MTKHCVASSLRIEIPTFPAYKISSLELWTESLTLEHVSTTDHVLYTYTTIDLPLASFKPSYLFVSWYVL